MIDKTIAIMIGLTALVFVIGFGLGTK